MTAGVEVRPATHDDYDDVATFTSDTWDHVEDYVADVFHDWVDGDACQTFVAVADGAAVGIAQVTAVSPTEGWAQGLRVDTSYRGQGVGSSLVRAAFAWARERGLSVVRNMVFSWNPAGLGQSRAVGFDPVTEFRWCHPDPGVAGETGRPAECRGDAGEAWSVWCDSDARAHLAGLGLALDESWALRRLTREVLARAADETALLVVDDGDSRAFTYRTRTYERDREDTDGVETGSEYGPAVWTDLAAGRQLVDAVAADAAACGATEARVLVPETACHVSAAAALRVDLADHTDFVLAAPLD